MRQTRAECTTLEQELSRLSTEREAKDRECADLLDEIRRAETERGRDIALSWTLAERNVVAAAEREAELDRAVLDLQEQIRVVRLRKDAAQRRLATLRTQMNNNEYCSNN